MSKDHVRKIIWEEVIEIVWGLISEMIWSTKTAMVEYFNGCYAAIAETAAAAAITAIGGGSSRAF